MKAFNKDGSLTKYSFTCGYVQKKGFAQLWKEHFCYHIAATINNKMVHQETDSLTKARDIFRFLSKGKIYVERGQLNLFV